MKNRKLINFIAGLVLMIVGGKAIFAQTELSPRVFLLDANLLRNAKKSLSESKATEDSFRPELEKLESAAQKISKTQIASIITKQALPPSGDKHDYMSQAPYFWKNPDTKNGFPYVRRDGERNPEIRQFPDHDLLDKMIEATETLSLAYYFTGKEEYAARASEILRMWFLDEKTKMNPNLEYAQAIPGLNTGRGIGIIETRGLTRVVDAIGLLNGSKSWTKSDQAGLQDWFSKFREWLMTSKNGRDESSSKNNHGTFYDVQVTCFALFTGKKDLAQKVLETAKQKRIALQIEPDGRQPLELERTKSWDYSTMNLEGLTELAKFGEAAGVDLWNFQTADKRGIREAIDFLYSYAVGEKKWTDQQIEPFKGERLFPIMRRAAGGYRDEKYLKMMQSIPKPETGDKISLLGL